MIIKYELKLMSIIWIMYMSGCMSQTKSGSSSLSAHPRLNALVAKILADAKSESDPAPGPEWDWLAAMSPTGTDIMLQGSSWLENKNTRLVYEVVASQRTADCANMAIVAHTVQENNKEIKIRYHRYAWRFGGWVRDDEIN